MIMRYHRFRWPSLAALALACALGRSAPRAVEAPAAAGKVREPAVAGLFYPKDPAELGRLIDDCLAAAKPGGAAGRTQGPHLSPRRLSVLRPRGRLRLQTARRPQLRHRRGDGAKPLRRPARGVGHGCHGVPHPAGRRAGLGQGEDARHPAPVRARAALLRPAPGLVEPVLAGRARRRHGRHVGAFRRSRGAVPAAHAENLPAGSGRLRRGESDPGGGRRCSRSSTTGR